MRAIDDIAEEYDFLDSDERYRLLIELGRELEPMPAALKTDAYRGKLMDAVVRGVDSHFGEIQSARRG